MSYPRSQAQTKVREHGIEVGTSLRHDVCLLDYRPYTDKVKRKKGMLFVVAQSSYTGNLLKVGSESVRFWLSLCMLDNYSEVSA